MNIDGKQGYYPNEPGIVYFFKADSRITKYDTGHTVAIKSALNLIPQHMTDSFLHTCEKCKNKWGDILWEELKWHTLSGISWRINNTSNDIKNEDWFYLNTFMNVLNQRAKCKEVLMFPFEIYEDLCISHVVIPSKCTDRIKQQQGFFIFPKYPICDDKTMDEIQTDIDQSVSKLSAEVRVPNKKKSVIAVKIPGERKEAIKSELSKLGINEGFIYPDIEHRSNALLNSKNIYDISTGPAVPVWK